VSSPEGGDGGAIDLLFPVSDIGKGMEQEETDRLFHRFQQGTKKPHIKYGGSGLGLLISRELTQAMS
jgi:signal transduction histidine kinase